jgi:hypothetical protein
LIIDNNNNIEGEQTMNDQVKVESVENTATQTNAGVNEVSEIKKLRTKFLLPIS